LKKKINTKVLFCVAGKRFFLTAQRLKLARDKQRLGALRVLTLRGNQIEVLPCEITRLKSLNIFMMDNNKISVLPDEIGKFICTHHLFDVSVPMC
jgi:hypothetical protein